MSQALYVGIDLGTTNSSAAVFDGREVTLVRNGQGSLLTPSVVRLDARGQATVGARARRFLDSHPQDTASEFKRLMGTSEEIPFAAAGVRRTPVDLSAEVLRSLRQDMADQLGVAPTCAVLSVPALFELPQCSATSEAARQAGFERCELLQEPIASALAAGWSAESPPGPWLVYDLGGGTFDASLLEETEGFLRVMGHEGDNYLGGRDFDQAVVDWAVEEIRKACGVEVRRTDPGHRDALRRLRHAAEEARIELSRGEAANLFVSDLLGADVDLVLDRSRLEGLCAPLVERTLEICRRLLARHGVDLPRLARVVLVGGPTVTPFLRRRLAEALGAPFGENLDPMTLVARGAALHAAAAGLDGRPARASEGGGVPLVLHYPSMTSDPRPAVVGRLLAPERDLEAVRLTRADGWTSDDAVLDARGGFVATVDLQPHQLNRFHLQGVGPAGKAVAVHPDSVTLVHGTAVGDPPLSRTVGVATAHDHVQVFFDRGTPLPARRTWTFQTVETLVAGSGAAALRVPLVQGESRTAHLCRLVGVLEVSGEGLAGSLAAGSPVEVTVEIDRSGRLSAQAVLPSQGGIFHQVAHLAAPEAPVERLREVAEEQRRRLEDLRSRPGSDLEKALQAGFRIAQAEREAEAAQGGDADAAQRARRTLLEVEEALEDLAAGERWTELDRETGEVAARASGLVALHGTEAEKRLLEQALGELEEARSQRRLEEYESRRRIVENLAVASLTRDPDYLGLAFQSWASRADEATDLPRARLLVEQGQAALARGDRERLRDLTGQLADLIPPGSGTRDLGYRSGVR